MRPTKPAVYNSRTADKFVVRLPDGMRERLASVARDHHRSMNSEIISRLERSLNDPTQAEEDINMIDLPVDPWTPIEGMMVTFRKGVSAGVPDKLLRIMPDGKGGFRADLSGGATKVQFSELKPYLVV